MAHPSMHEPVLKRRRRDVKNPLVFFDISIGSQKAGEIVFELFSDVVPKVMPSMSQRCSERVEELVCNLGTIFMDLMIDLMCETFI